MSSIFLPSELIQIIINELHADKPALRSCSLVCHSWAHIAQRCLFTHISFATVWFGPPQNKSLMPRFHTITSTAPHLLRYVRILEFDPTIDAVQYLFANSTTVEEVRLVYFIGDMSKVEDVAEILSLPSVTRLTVRENASYPAQIIPLLRHCPQLRSLTISRVMPDQLAACDPMTLASKAIQLESLALSRLTPEILSDLAENVLDLTQLRSFSAKFHPIFYDHNRIERAVPVLRKLLQSIDGTLEHLTLDVALPEPLHKLTDVSRLRTLEVCLPEPSVKSESPYVRHEATLSWLLASLENLECTSLEYITIRKVPRTDASIQLTSRIDFHLSKLPRLLHACVKLCCASPARDLFPLLHGRGILRQYF